MSVAPGALRRVQTDQAPTPAGHYAQATVAGGLVFVSGQLPITPDGHGLAAEDFETQTRQAVHNLLAILRAAGAEPAQLVRVTAYIVGVAHWPRFNAVYAQLLPQALPARTVVPVPELHHGCLVELDAIAALPA